MTFDSKLTSEMAEGDAENVKQVIEESKLETDEADDTFVAEEEEEEEEEDEEDFEEEEMEMDINEIVGLNDDASALFKSIGENPALLKTLMADTQLELHNAIKAHDIEAVKTIVNDESKKHLIEQSDSYKYTPLHLAVDAGLADIVAVLLEKGANVEAESCLQQSRPLHYAAMNGNVEMAELLLAKGADIEALTSDGRTALYQAALCNNLEFVQFMVSKGASTLVNDAKGVSPAQATTDPEVKTFLLKSKSSSKAQVN